MSEPRVDARRLAAILSYSLKGSENSLSEETASLAFDLRDEREKNARLREAEQVAGEMALESERQRLHLLDELDRIADIARRALAGDSTLPPGFSIHDGADATKDTPFGPGIVVGDSTP